MIRPRSAAAFGLLMLAAMACGQQAAPPPSAPLPALGSMPAKPTARPSMPAPAPAPPGGRQRAFAGHVGRISVFAIIGEEYTARIGKMLPLLPVVVRVTNGEPGNLVLSREHDEWLLRRRDGSDARRIDVWEDGALMTQLATLPADDRARFRYPDFVVPGAAVEYTITFDRSIALDDVQRVWVRLAALPSMGVWLEPVPERRAPVVAQPAARTST